MNPKMTPDEISDAFDAAFGDKLARKPSRWEECETVNLADLDAKMQDWILGLPRYIGYERPLDDLRPADVCRLGQYYIRETLNGRRYLVDTQGFHYARYAVEIRA